MLPHLRGERDRERGGSFAKTKIERRMKLNAPIAWIAATLFVAENPRIGVGVEANATSRTTLNSRFSIFSSWPSYFEPSLFAMKELESGARRDELLHELRTTGIIAIGGESESESNEEALEAWCQCYDSHHNPQQPHDDNSSTMEKLIPSIQSIALEDGLTKRTTLASATVGLAPLALAPQIAQVCGPHVATVLDEMRDIVHDASQAFVHALDYHVLNKNNDKSESPNRALLSDVHGKTYPTVTSIVEAATHLEHVHIYEKQQGSSPHKYTKTLDFHTDAGLFLAFVPGYDCRDSSDASNSFWVRTTMAGGGMVQRPVKFSAQTRAVIMLGVGAARWLNSDTQLQATEHAVELYAGQRRAWYGKSTCCKIRW